MGRCWWSIGELASLDIVYSSRETDVEDVSTSEAIREEVGGGHIA